METEIIQPQLQQETFEQASKMFTFLWISYLAQWGPKARRTVERAEHHHRLHALMDWMGEIESPYEGTTPWENYLDLLPGFRSYWSPEGELGMKAHHAE